ncbi:hypothetical protein NYE40_02470 [Paenibacillus sp. FSL W8-1187]|uniref:hypothetical protein n=1 Tax=Paenibacillus sp. FSL W8-1187 TaxID=2975339 RepID=UPI0030DBBDDA
MKSSWFRKLLLSYLPAFFIVVSILFVVFFQALNEQSRKEAAKANDFLVQQAIRHADNSLRAMTTASCRTSSAPPCSRTSTGRRRRTSSSTCRRTG